MEEIIGLDYERENGQLTLQLTTEQSEYMVNGFESLFLDHVGKVLDSDFEDSTLFFRDQPYQKLVISKKDEGLLNLSLSYPETDKDTLEMKVESKKFESFLGSVKKSLNR